MQIIVNPDSVNPEREPAHIPNGASLDLRQSFPFVDNSDKAYLRTLLSTSAEGAAVIPALLTVRTEVREFAQAACREKPFYHLVRGKGLDLSAGLDEKLRQEVGLDRGRAWYIEGLRKHVDFLCEVAGCKEAMVAVRNSFWPLDAIWHIDSYGGEGETSLSAEDPLTLRMVWAIGRGHGTLLTPYTNYRFDELSTRYQANFGVLQEIQRLARTSQSDAIAFANVNQVLQDLIASQNSVLLNDANKVFEVPSERLGILRGGHPALTKNGTVHRTDERNRAMPGLQAIITCPIFDK